MLNFLKKKKKKVYDKWFLLIFATVVVCLGIGNELYKGTSAIELPVNESFDDMSFYMCVVDAYNEQKVESLEKREYTDNLTDEELAVITYLNCSAIGNGVDNVDNIKSTKGIEKLVSLVELQLFEHDITSIDISKNTMLENVYLNDNKLTEINVSGNDKLLLLNIQNNKLTNIDVSNNDKLQVLNVSENQLTSIDVSNNDKLLGLYVNDNKLTELDLSNNNKLEFVVSLNNSFSRTLNLYKGDNVTLESVENVINLPSEMSQDMFSWLIWDFDESNIISIDNDVVTALNGGTIDVFGGIDHDDITNMEADISYFLINNTINVIDISSEEYLINKNENFVYVGVEEIDVSKINVVGFNLTEESNKLKILSEEEKVITELDILGLNFGDLKTKNNVINITSELAYENFISNIVISDKLSYKILNSNSEVIETGNLLGGEKVEIYYGDILLDTYEIKIISEVSRDVIFNDDVILDEENGYVKYKESEFSVKKLFSNLEVVGDARVFVSSINGEEKHENDIVVTGDILTVFVGSEKHSEYMIAIRGDTNGDGRVSLTDLVQLRKHLVGWRNPETGLIENKIGVYFYALDMNNDGKISLIDLVRVRKVIVGIDIDE